MVHLGGSVIRIATAPYHGFSSFKASQRCGYDGKTFMTFDFLRQLVKFPRRRCLVDASELVFAVLVAHIGELLQHLLTSGSRTKDVLPRIEQLAL
jgi:hypothetical protein